MTRKLAAIIAADVVGYSRLMGGDEAGTLAAHKTHRPELIDPKIAEREGRIVRTTGDGLLIEFPSVVEAVHGDDIYWRWRQRCGPARRAGRSQRGLQKRRRATDITQWEASNVQMA
jgi:class 3 adenylate cyclase